MHAKGIAQGDQNIVSIAKQTGYKMKYGISQMNAIVTNHTIV
jgi:hypothetical protein